MFTRILSAAALVGVVLGFSAQSSQAHGWIVDPDHREYLTFNKPIALPGVILAAGTYVFEMPNGGVSLGLVRVSSRDSKQTYLTQFTRVVDRPESAKDRHVTFGEAAKDAAPPIATWYPNGERSGRQFIYN